jgi:hypothetical protein
MFAYGLSSFSCAQRLSRMNTPGSRQILAALWQAPSVAGVNSAAMPVDDSQRGLVPVADIAAATAKFGRDKVGGAARRAEPTPYPVKI